MVQVFTYKRIKRNKNNSLVRCIYRLKIETMHAVTEISKNQTILPKFSLRSSYDILTMDISYILLLRRLIKR